MLSRLHRDTPLWPAGHLPLKGGDHRRLAPRPAISHQRSSLQSSLLFAPSLIEADGCAQLISPLEGEMAGRPEGGWHGTALTIGGPKP